MIVDILGLGESLNQFKPSLNTTIGVNDIFKKHQVDYLVVIDRPHRFDKDRLKTIIESNPKKFYTHLDDWQPLVSNYQEIILSGPRGSIDNIEGNNICYSNNSTYVAVVIAYKLGASQINIFGADFNTHPNFLDHRADTTLKDFKQLFIYLKSKGITINISDGSRLNEVI